MKNAVQIALMIVCSTALAQAAPKLPSYERTGQRGSLKLRPYSETTLKNGLRVLFVEDAALPYISYNLMIRAGSFENPKDREGLSAMVAELIKRGTKESSATQLADQVGVLGAEWSSMAEPDFTLVHLGGLAIYEKELLHTLSSMVSSPTFAEAEIKRVRKEMLSSRQRMMDNPDALAQRAFLQYLFADHPYGHPSGGTVKSLAQIQRKDIIKFYLQYYRPNNSYLAVVGQFSKDIKEQLEDAFKDWRTREVAPRAHVVQPESQTGIRLVTNPSLTQSQVMMGHKGIRHDDPDFLKLKVGNQILSSAGSLAGRLQTRIRGELGLTYAIQSAFDARFDEGPFFVATFTRNPKVEDIIRETQEVLRRFVKDGATDQEVAAAKSSLLGHFPLAIETAEKLAANLMLLRFYGVPDTYLTRYFDNIDRITTAQVNEALRRHLDPEHLKILVYSVPLTATQLKGFGSVEAVRAAGVP